MIGRQAIGRSPLVAWKKLMQPRDRGGLGFMDCATHANALLCKWVSKALVEPSLEWAKLFLALSMDYKDVLLIGLNTRPEIESFWEGSDLVD